MTNYLLLLTITFAVLISAALIINFCKRRAAATSHGLTGMCHKSGGTMCSCCGSKLAASSRSLPSSQHKGC